MAKEKKTKEDSFPLDLKKIIKKNTYNQKETKDILKNVRETIKKIDKALDKNNILAKSILGGSSAKGTFLKGEFDCDVFVRFSEEYKQNSEKISDFLEPVIKDITDDSYQRVHGSRDYFQFQEKGIEFEIVPVIYIDDYTQALNVTDVSPLHVAWIKEKMKKNKNLKDDIILTKTFMKAQELYGAESYIRGFSGHVVDILTAYYGSFLELLKGSTTWEKFQVIDIEKHYKSKEEAKKNLNKSKISPLIVIDPIQKFRNAAASLSNEKFRLMKNIAAGFLEEPDEQYFVRKETSVEDIKNHAKNNNLEAIIIEAEPKSEKKDVAGAKLLKVFNHLSKGFKEHDFKVVDKKWQWQKRDKNTCLMWFYFEKKALPKTKENIGPPLKEKIHVNLFKMKYKNTYKKDNRICAEVKRDYTKPRQLAKELIDSIYVKEKVSDIKLR